MSFAGVSQENDRPIVRGKASCKTDFIPKLSVSLVDGIAMVDHLGWRLWDVAIRLVKAPTIRCAD